MPAITTGKILVTGANGFIARWIIKDLLEHGLSVRATVRSLDKADALKPALATTYGDSLEFIAIEDFTVETAFTLALQGVVGVVHVASPTSATSDEPDAIIGPAVQSVTGILSAASAPGSTIKRIVYISSVSAVTDSGRFPDIWTDKDWNDTDVKTVKEKGSAASLFEKYQASKTLAERKAWELYNEGKANGTIGWDLVTLCPPWVFGPFLGEVTPESLNYSVGSWYRTVVQENLPLPPPLDVEWTDVRDFASASRLSLTKAEAGGERFVISAGSTVWGHWVNAARRILRKGGEPRPESHQDGQKLVGFDSQKSRDLLGLQYHTIEETTAFILDDFNKRGWA